jgi:hypothetical protein
MASKVSDFKLAESVLKSISIEKGIPFIDVSLDFALDSDNDINSLFIGSSKNTVHTTYKIVDKYISMMEKINKPLFESVEKKENFLINFSSELRALIYQGEGFSDYLDELTSGTLYQKSLIWILLKDIVCPVFNLTLKNVKTICGENSYIDIAKFYNNGEVKDSEGNSYSFIFINYIDCPVVQNAFVFVEALRAYEADPIVVIKDILQTELCDKFKGLLRLAFDDNKKVEKFIFVLANIVGIDLFKMMPQKESKSSFGMKKYAQIISPEVSSQWWYLGVIERMMERARGTDWSTYETLEQQQNEFWDKVEKVKMERQAKGKDKEVPFDLLLRLKSTDTTDARTDPTKTLQELLSSERIW